MSRGCFQKLAHCLVVALSVVFGSDTAFAQRFFAQSPGTPIWGRPLSESDLTGKVVYIEYWGIHCGPCRAVFPALVECQRTYAPTGRFVMLGSHLQPLSPEVATFLEAQQCNFTVYQQYICPSAPPEGGGIPQAYLLSHQGELVASGHPAEVMSKVQTCVEAAVKASGTGFGFTPCSEVEWPNDLAKIGAMFTSSRAWKMPMTQLEKRASSKKGSPEAEAILETINAAIDAELARLGELRETRPTETLIRLTLLKKNLAGLPQGAECSEMLETLADESGVEDLQKAWSQLLAFQKKVQGGRVSQAAGVKEARKIVRAIEKIAERDDISSAVRTEAQELADFATAEYCLAE